MRASDKWIGTGESAGVVTPQAFAHQDDSPRALSNRPMADPAGTGRMERSPAASGRR
jgi:hypothetical protein